MRKKSNKAAMYFASLEIENIKSFGQKQILDLRDKNGVLSHWTLILGDNGIGKTTLLKCLAWMIPVEETDEIGTNETDNSGKKIKMKPFMDGFEKESEYEEIVRKGDIVTSRVAATFTNNIQLGDIPKNTELISHGISIKTLEGKLNDIELEYGELEEFNAPNLYAYSANRHMATKNFEKSELKENTFNLFSNSGDLYDAEQLLSILDTASLRQNRVGKAADLLKKVKEILVDLLPYVIDSESIIINSPLNEDGSTNDILVEIQTVDGKVPLYNLSLGYITMLAWTVDLALRMLWSNPESDAPLKEPAVVIVDEIDLHLHPKWQRTLREFLTNHFENTQFICTAHSPFMAQSSEFENLCVINRINEYTFIENDPVIVEGWRIGQVITNLFGVSERSNEIEAMVKERRDILDKKNPTVKDKQKLKELDKKLSDLPVSLADNIDDIVIADKISKLTELINSKVELND